MKTIPNLSRPSSMKPGVYLNYGGSRGTLFAVPLFDPEGTHNGRAVLFGTSSTTFTESTIALEQSFLIGDLSFELPPLLEMVSGLGSLEVGCLCVSGAEVLIAVRDPFDDFVWLSLNTGRTFEPRAHRHFFRSWTMVVEVPGAFKPLFKWPME